jgi:hypothetical protein
MRSGNPEDDRPNMVDLFFAELGKPHNLARIIKWAWFISLLVLVLGYIIIILNLAGKLNI